MTIPIEPETPNAPTSDRPLLAQELASLTPAMLARKIDHTLLRPTATRGEILATCQDAHRLGTRTVCVASRWVALATEALANSETQVCTVIGFPHGNASRASKIAEARAAIDAGARELDLVISLGDLCDEGNDDAQALVVDEIRNIVDVSVALDARILVKVILETALLSSDQITRGCALAVRAGAHYVKTSTGFASGGASLEAVRLMRRQVGDLIGVKASGGIKTALDAEAMLTAGASRIGASATAQILEQWAALRNASG